MRSDAFSGGRWGAIRSVVLQVASLGTTAVLARLLSNEEFGIVAITVVVLTMFDLITRVGLGASVVRRDPLTDRLTSTFFWLSAGLGLAAGLLAVAVSRPAAALAGSVDAASLVALAAVTLPLNLSSRVPMALLTRFFKFRARAAVEIIGALTHSIVAIVLAFAGLGALAVVIGQVARSVVMFVLAFVTSGFRPKWLFDRVILREELSFNVGWLTTDLVTYANKNTDYWFVGNTIGTGPLGVYYVAYVVPNLLRRRVTAIGHEIIYPIASRIKDDPARILSALMRIVRLVTFVILPSMLGLAVLADLVVQIGFGPGWTGAIGPLRVIAVAAAVTSMTVVANPIFASMGRPWIQVGIGLIALAVLVAGLVISLSAGTVTAVAYAVLAAATVEGVAVLVRLRSLIGLSVREYAGDVFPYVTSALVMALAVWGLRHLALGGFHEVVETVVAVAFGAVVYLGIGALFFKDQFRDQWSSVKGLIMPSKA